jgi:hypothetical protein
MLPPSVYGFLLLFLLFFACTERAVAAPLDTPAAKIQPQRQEGITVFSIAPTQAEPGTQVTITYGGEINGAQVLLGGDEVPFQRLDARKIAFLIPVGRAPGQYVLTVKALDGATRSYAFTVLPLKPVVTKIEPDRITTCTSDSSQDVVVYGKNFSEISQVIFDGAILPNKYNSSESISFTVPRVKGGLHQVAVKNINDVAAPVGLLIITAPVISSVSIGDDRVSSYDLAINGINFQQNSIVIANGNQISSSSDMQAGGQLTYIDCNRIVYQRRPYSSTRQELRIQVVNPGGEISQMFVVSAP